MTDANKKEEENTETMEAKKELVHKNKELLEKNKKVVEKHDMLLALRAKVECPVCLVLPTKGPLASCPKGHLIWVSFCRTGILTISCHIFSKSRAFV